MEGIAETTTTPVSTPETTTAAPATTETTSAPTTSQRPTNVRELAAYMEKAATTQTAPAAPQETAATGQAANPDLTSATAGPVPFAAHKTALDNARTKAVAEYREKYGWAEQVPQAQLQEFSQLASRMSTDPVGFATAFMQELQAHPTYGPQLKSQAARMLGARQANTEPQPDVQIVDANGQVTGVTYSASQLAKRDAWNKANLLAEVQKEFGPLKTDHDKRAAEAAAAETTRQANALADEILVDEVDGILEGAYSRKDEAILTEVNKLMAANPTWSVHKAANKVRKDFILPTLDKKAEARVVETFNKKAAGNTANGTAPATPTRPRNAKELAAWMEANF